MAQDIRKAFRKGQKKFQKMLRYYDCVTVNYCTHVSVYTRNGNFVVELEY